MQITRIFDIGIVNIPADQRIVDFFSFTPDTNQFDIYFHALSACGLGYPNRETGVEHFNAAVKAGIIFG